MHKNKLNATNGILTMQFKLNKFKQTCGKLQFFISILRLIYNRNFTPLFSNVPPSAPPFDPFQMHSGNSFAAEENGMLLPRSVASFPSHHPNISPKHISPAYFHTR